MRLSIKTKQVAGVTAIVGLAAIVMSGWYLATLARVLFAQTRVRADLIAKTAYQQAFYVLGKMPPGADPGLQPVIKALVFLGNLCFSPLAALVSTIIYFVIKDQKPRTAKDLCQMTWIPFVIACVLWILYFVFVFGLAILGSAGNM